MKLLFMTLSSVLILSATSNISALTSTEQSTSYQNSQQLKNNSALEQTPIQQSDIAKFKSLSLQNGQRPDSKRMASYSNPNGDNISKNNSPQLKDKKRPAPKSMLPDPISTGNVSMDNFKKPTKFRFQAPKNGQRPAHKDLWHTNNSTNSNHNIETNNASQN